MQSTITTKLEPTMEIDEISARLTVLETVVRQLITHMAIRDDDPARWVQTRKTLAMNAIDADGADGSERVALLHEAITEFFDQAEVVASEYSFVGKPGTPRPFVR
jgi:hypothetical protein